FNSAHPVDELKYGQARLSTDAAIDLSNPTTAATYQTNLTTGRTASRAYIDTLLANGGAPVDAIMSLTATTDDVAIRPRSPQVTMGVGYAPRSRRPKSFSFPGTAGDDAKLLGFGYAFERSALVRQTPSEINPQTWHCIAPIVYIDRSGSCEPGNLAPADVPP